MLVPIHMSKLGTIFEDVKRQKTSVCQLSKTSLKSKIYLTILEAYVTPPTKIIYYETHFLVLQYLV